MTFATIGRATCAALLMALAYWAASPAAAQAWPDRPVRVIVAFGTGGTIDGLTRIIADKLSDKWKQGVVVENRPGAAGNIGAVTAAQAAPDGYTLHMGGQPLTANVTLAPIPNLDPVRDFAPIVFIAYAQDVLMVGKDSPYTSLKDLLAAGMAKPGEFTYGSLGIGSSGHLATVLLSDLTGLRARHVPYTNVGQMQADVSAARVSFWISTLGGQLGVIKGGNLRALAVSGAARARELPAVPTFQELGIPLVEPSSWFGLFAPKNTPQDIVSRVNADVNSILKTPEIQDKLQSLGFNIVGGAPDFLSKIMPVDIAKWDKVYKSPAYSAQ
jgi:tripartite-type tricarboxylate transporter receptor subunit TctC